MKSLNINSTVKVKLTETGKQILKQEHEKSFGVNSPKFPFILNEDIFGYSEFQLWDLMEKFGPHDGLCKPMCYQTEILIADSDLKESSHDIKSLITPQFISDLEKMLTFFYDNQDKIDVDVDWDEIDILPGLLKNFKAGDFD